MAYFPKYKLEFDTVKDRSVLVSIDKEGIYPYSQTFLGEDGDSFVISGNSIIITDAAPNNLPDINDISPGDILTFSKTGSANNGDYIITGYSVTEFGGTKLGTFTIEGNFPSNTEGVNFTISINPPDPVSLTGYSQSPLEINYPNGEFEKMCPIRESKARIRIVPDVVEAADFVIDYDTQYKVTVSIFGDIIWKGWLSNDLITEPFLDVADVIELSASDGLSILKTKPLADENDEQLWGKYKAIKFIWNALFHNKLELEIGTYINMYPEGYFERDAGIPGETGWDIFDQVWMMSHTFLKGPREFDDCYEVLSKIMQAFGCTLFQGNGKWWIVQNNDRVAGVLNGTNRDFEGNYLSIQMANARFPITVGLNQTTKLINADALLSYEKPFKEVAVKYRFEEPPIFFRNWDLLDGILDNAKSTSTRKIYELQYWLPGETWNLIVPGQINGSKKAYIGVDINTATNAEVRRYMVLYRADNDETAIKTTRYPVNQNDVLNVGFSARLNTALPPNNTIFYKCVVKLIGNNGTNYYLSSDSNWYTSYQSLIKVHISNVDTRLWTDFFGGNTKPLPVSGFVEMEFTSHGVFNATEVHFKDMTMEVISSFNELVTVDGFEFKSENSENIRNKYDNDLFVSHSPNVSMAGALLTAATEPTLLTNFKYKGSSYPTVMPFAKYIGRSYYRTMYREFIKLEGAIYNFYGYVGGLNPLNSIEVTEIPNKEFMLTTMQIDVRQETAEVTMIELRNTNNTNDFTENGIESFRYLNVKAKDENDPLKAPRFPIDWRYGIFGVLQSLNRTKKMRRFNNYQ